MSAFFRACRSSGYHPEENTYLRCIGGNPGTVKQSMLERYGNAFPWETVEKAWMEELDQEVSTKPIPFKRGAELLIETLQRTAVTIAIVTSSRTEKACNKLENAGILPLFDIIVSGDTVTEPKPSPEIYLKACESVGRKPIQCLALEDSENGVRSALAAGCYVIQVPDLVQPSEEVRKLGHVIVDSLTDVVTIVENMIVQND